MSSVKKLKPVKAAKKKVSANKKENNRDGMDYEELSTNRKRLNMALNPYGAKFNRVRSSVSSTILKVRGLARLRLFNRIEKVEDAVNAPFVAEHGLEGYIRHIVRSENCKKVNK